MSLDLTDIEKEIIIADSDDSLMLYCYEDCHEDSDPRVKECRGVVCDYSGNIVLKTFGYIPEYGAITQNKEMLKTLLPEFSKYRVFDSHESCLIRVFYHGEKWYVATHRKLDAYKSKWGSAESFGDIFEKALFGEYNKNKKLQKRIGEGLDSSKTVEENYLASLDKTRTYAFLIRNVQNNRIVCRPPDDYTLYYSGSFLPDGTGFEFDNVDIAPPTERFFANVEEAVEYVEKCDPYSIQGVIVFTPSPVKIMNKKYMELFSLRDNEPSIKFRYLHMRTTPDSERFRELYPENKESFDQYEEILGKVAENIHMCYIRRFVMREFAVVPQEQYPIVQQCHNYYIENIKTNRKAPVTLGVVMGILNQQNPTTLNKIIRKYILDSSKE